MDEAFRTDDMTLAAVLALDGHKYRLESMIVHNRKWVNWIFPCDNGERAEINLIVSRYLTGDVTVEPRAFVTHTSAIREEMYRVVGTPDRRIKGSREASSQA